jgi:hypothetical protein
LAYVLDVGLEVEAKHLGLAVWTFDHALSTGMALVLLFKLADCNAKEGMNVPRGPSSLEKCDSGRS